MRGFSALILLDADKSVRDFTARMSIADRRRLRERLFGVNVVRRRVGARLYGVWGYVTGQYLSTPTCVSHRFINSDP